MADDLAQTAHPASAIGLADQLISILTSPSATAIGWIASVIGLVLGAIPLFLYVKEKRSNDAMRQLAEEFNLNQRVRERLTETQAEKKNLENESAKLLSNVQSFEADIKERLPREAKIAFLTNAIPVMEEQIYALVSQKDNMVRTLSEMKGTGLTSPAAIQILSAESEIRLSAKRQIDTLQIQLSILTGLTSIILYLVPYPIDRVIVFFLAIPLALLLVNIARLVRYVYPDALISKIMRRIERRPYFSLAVAVAALIFLALVSVAAVVSIRHVRF